MEFDIGQVVISKAGRDNSDAFIIYNIEGEYLYLVDGANRTLERPKKKKRKHVQPTKNINYILQEAILHKKNLKDADFRSALKDFKERKREVNSNG